ncbi:transcriptional regulatory protein YehT [Kordia sp. SMS9]|uniref:LytR/AlgR family response regulator transcription factor n=1 Tax=Kordia sp. SMS9 TaxID=2282170 RepID=UPI000E0DDB18|nr:LytTR family DNA-binding domain-containing protein [Kordia sp. SMS9]AXG67969.1 transcriptional regulatory protein YehT [Kordia sp. SMS9]
MINAIIIEDEQSSMEYLVAILKQHHSYINITSWASDVENAVKLIQRKKPEIVFLDIQLNDGSGFQVLDALQSEMNFEVIFTTGFLDYKEKAMDYFAFYYLNKPIQTDELKRVLDMYMLKRSAFDKLKFEALKQQIASKGESITIYERGKYTSIRCASIVYCEASGSYTNVYLRSGEQVMISKNLKSVEELLEHKDFFRVHRSFLVNVKQVKKFTPDGIVTLSNGVEITTSIRNRKKVIHFLSLYNKKNI